jgi:hypothetical protein
MASVGVSLTVVLGIAPWTLRSWLLTNAELDILLGSIAGRRQLGFNVFGDGLCASVCLHARAQYAI